MTHHFVIGDAAIPRSEPDHDVMTIYDFERGATIALCNWVVGTRMFKDSFPVRDLAPIARRQKRSEPK
jgi:hypothetical protein